MLNVKHPIMAAALACTPAAPAFAVEQIVDFTQGNFCNGGKLCTNNAAIDQGHGSTAEVKLTHLSTIFDGYTDGPLWYYERGFGDLVGVAYATKGSIDPSGRGRIIFSAQEGFELSLRSFDVGCFNGISNCRTMIYDLRGDDGTLSGSMATGYPGHSTVTLNTDYSSFFDFNFGAGENVGIDNIRWDVRQIGVAAVPEPATWAMMIGGFGLVGGAMRRRATAPVLA